MAQKILSETHDGNDLYRKMISPKSQKLVKITYWDCWILLVLTNDFAGNWESMIDYLKKKKGLDYGRALEGILNHIRFLHKKLDDTGLKIDDILADTDSLKRQMKKARRKILDADVMDKEKSDLMINTPHKICEKRAMRGHWNKFPVNPETYASLLEGCYKISGFYKEDQSFGLENKLSSFIERYERKTSISDRFALYRAFLTVVLEKIGMVDDSYGVIGDLYEDIFEKYFSLDHSKLAMPSQIFFLDLIELLIWEAYGFTYQKQPSFFASITSQQVPLVESILQQQWNELNQLDLEYQAEEALTMLGILYVQQQQFDEFIPCAKLMGTRHWKRITTMSEMAEQHHKYDLALAVYENCLGPGEHEKFLRDKYNKLQSKLQLRRKKIADKPDSKNAASEKPHIKPKYTEKQGQYLAFINHYRKIHGQSPAEADMQQYFKTTPSSVHQMILKLEKLGFITRIPSQPRSIEILLSQEELS